MAAAIATEWNTQAGDIRPAEMPLTQLANTAIDRVMPQRDLIVRQIADYAGTDLVCYRAIRPPALTARQHEVWQPLLDWAVLRYDAPLDITAGVIPVAQPPASLRAFAAAVAAHDDFALAALHLATAACGSLVIALALVDGPARRRRSLCRLAARRKLSDRSLGRGLRAGPAPSRRSPPTSPPPRNFCRCCAPSPGFASGPKAQWTC